MLALIAEGVSTAYELMVHAELSPGATLPVLKRLRDNGFVRTMKAETRNRAAFKITPSGRRWLRSGWQDLLTEEPSGSLDTILRTALLASLVGRDRGAAESLLHRAAELRGTTPAPSDRPEILSPELATRYRTMRASISSELRSVESNILTHLATQITRGGRPHKEAKRDRSKRLVRPS